MENPRPPEVILLGKRYHTLDVDAQIRTRHAEVDVVSTLGRDVDRLALVVDEDNPECFVDVGQQIGEDVLVGHLGRVFSRAGPTQVATLAVASSAPVLGLSGSRRS